ncbi:glycosyltransferase [Brachybacterium vulturis]|uniref:glycosyltransferase n=1 Tax=Brachybacterium vulturis TaxID=2017484 RepID=UPI003736FF26
MGAVPPSTLPSCSVVVPVRDDARELEGLLAALRRQTRTPLEIIVVDNGSLDDSAEVARAGGCRVVVETEPGIPAAAAAGYDAARGELILRCDADSRPGPGWIAAHQDAHARHGPSRVIVTGPAHFRLLPPFGTALAVLYLGTYMLTMGAALGHLPAFGTTMSMRRAWWARVSGGVSRRCDVHDDMDLSFQVGPGEQVRLACGARVGMSPRALRLRRDGRLRWQRALSTLRRNWRRQRPWERWAARLGPPIAARRERRADRDGS